MDLRIRELTKQYPNGVLAIDRIDLELDSGMVGILGPNGAGKSTLMKILATLLQPSDGQVTFDGIDIIAEPDRLRPVLGYLPQEFQAYPQLSVTEFLDYCASLSGITDREENVRAAIEKVELEEKRDALTRTLSGGMTRRLGIAQALLNDPQLLIVDEPTAGLDPAARIQFRNLLASLSGDRIVLLSTHIVEDVANTCHEVVVLDDGSVLLHGSPADLAQTAAGNVWELRVTKQELVNIQQRHMIISTVMETPDEWRVQVIAEEAPHQSATSVAPGIEEGYMQLLTREIRGA
jgi:ABC-type multidrug transport system ATPase subunit